MKPKLLVALNYFYPYISGVTEYARQIAAALRDDFDITILTGRHDGTLPEEETIEGMRVLRAATLFRLHKGYVSVDLIQRFARLAVESDIIQLHLPMLEAALLAYIGRRHAPVLINYHCDVTPTGGLIDWLAVRTALLSARSAARRADGIVVLTKDYARGSAVLAGLDAKLIEIPPITKMEGRVLQPMPARAPGSFNLGFVGRFAREKGIEVILDAIGPVAERIPGAKFLFAGETRAIAGGSIYGSVAEKLARHASSIEMLGRLTDDELWSTYAAVDVLLLPSVNSYEAFGLVQIEAMLAGALVIASDMRGVRVPVSVTGNGRLVAPGSVDSLVGAILACNALRQELSREQVRARTVKHFSNQTVHDRFVGTLNSLLKGGSRTKAYRTA